MNTSNLPTFGFGATQSVPLSGEEPMDTSEATDPLTDFESALRRPNFESFLSHNLSIIEDQVNHEFLNLRAKNRISDNSQYKMKFVNFLIQKSRLITKLIENPAFRGFEQLPIFKQLVTVYAQKAEMATHGFGVYTTIPVDQRTTNETIKMNQPLYQPLKSAITAELNSLNGQAQSFLLHTLQHSHINCNLTDCHNTADIIQMSTKCPLHYIYIQLLHDLEQYYNQQNVAPMPPPPSSYAFFG